MIAVSDIRGMPLHRVQNELAFIRGDRARGGPDRKELYLALQQRLSELTGRELQGERPKGL